MMDQKQRKLAELREKLLKEREEYYKKKEEVKNRQSKSASPNMPQQWG